MAINGREKGNHCCLAFTDTNPNDLIHNLFFFSEEGLPRRVRLQLSCSKDWTMADLAVVKNVTEIEKCVYHAELTSTIFCGEAFLHPALPSIWLLIN